MNATAATILVVDDEPDLRTLYELTLLREGYRVQTAGSVGEAREQLQNQTFDAVITDMRLPDGWAWSCCTSCVRSSAASVAW